MAWSIPSYGNIAAHGRPSNLRIAMFELIRGIDERVAAYSGAPSAYSWWIAPDPHTKLAPTLEDLEFLKCTGNKSGGTTANANKAYRNMQLIRDRIRAQLALGRYFTTSGGDTAYTIATMESAIGRGLDLPQSVTESSWWQAMQDALDRMIYLKRSLAPLIDSYDGGMSNPTSTFGDFGDGWEESWDERNTNDVVTGGGFWGTGGVFWAMSSYLITPPFPPIVIQSRIIRQSIARFKTTDLISCGDVVLANLVYQKNWGRWFLSTAVYSSPIAVDINGEEVTIAGAATNQLMVMTGASTSTDLIVTASITTEEPTDNPFLLYEFTPATTSGVSGLGFVNLFVYFDMSSVLTDQT